MRLEAFLAKKRANAVSSTSSPESESGGQSLEAPGKPPNQTAPGKNVRSGMETNLHTTSTDKVDSEGERRSRRSKCQFRSAWVTQYGMTFGVARRGIRKGIGKTTSSYQGDVRAPQEMLKSQFK